MTTVTINVPGALHPATQALVAAFAEALAAKLRRAEEKYGYSDEWLKDDWQADCVHAFHQHVAKGDPLDVAIYCAFMWHRDWTLNALPPTPAADRARQGQELYRHLNGICLGVDITIVGDALTALLARSIAGRVRGIEVAEAIADATARDIKASLRANWDERERKWR